MDATAGHGAVQPTPIIPKHILRPPPEPTQVRSMAKRDFSALDYAENAVDETLLKQKLGRMVVRFSLDSKQPVITVDRKDLAAAAKILRDDPALAFDMFTDLTAADLSERPEFEPERRFQVILILYSTVHRRRIRLKAYIPEADPVCPSVYGVYHGATFTEREAYEMFGIRFTGHPNLIRLLTPDYMKDYPLRKDYPVTGKGERDNFPRYEEVQ